MPDSLRLQAEGKVPFVFGQSAEARLNFLRSRQPDSTDAQKRYFYQTAKQVTAYLQSGKVLYNDQVSLYLAEVMDSLLVAEPALRAQLRVYAVKASAPNASVTADGLVLVNLGLMARVETEAELAFVISHEISHYARRHALKRLEDPASDGLDDTPLAKDLYNQAQEREADQAGLTRILRSRYKPTAALRVFGRLQGPGLTFPERALDLAWLAPGVGSPLPTCSEGESRPGPKVRSHPLPQDRFAALYGLARSLDTSKTADFLVSKRRFQRCRLASRYAITKLSLQARRYEEALTMAYSLWRLAPEASFSKEIAAKALYGLSAYADEGKLYEVHRPARLESMARLACLMERLTPRELNALALHYGWKHFGTDARFKPWQDDLMYRMGRFHISTREVIAPPESRALGWLQPVFDDANIAPMIDAQLEKGWNARNQELLIPPEPTTRKVIVVMPAYQHIDNRKKANPVLEEEEEDRKGLEERLVAYLSDLHYEPEIIYANDSAAFQQVAALQQWEREQRSHKLTHVISSQFHLQQTYIEAYQSPYFMWVGIVSQTERKTNKALKLLLGAPILPYTIINTFAPKHTTYLYMSLYDLNDGSLIYQENRTIPRADRPDVISASLYDMLSRVRL
ncbi:MAG: M48 family metallopeptidase [Bacteroidia bacterium]